MADKPADVDPAEFPDAATVQCDAVPEAVDDTPTASVDPAAPRSEVTGRHRLTSQQFANAVDQADLDGYQRGLQQGDALGYARGLADGQAAVSAEDWEDGVEAGLRAVKVYLVAKDFPVDNADAFIAAARPFVKRGG